MKDDDVALTERRESPDRSKARKRRFKERDVQPNPNKEPLGKRQISAIKRIIESGEPATKIANTSKINNIQEKKLATAYSSQTSKHESTAMRTGSNHTAHTPFSPFHPHQPPARSARPTTKTPAQPIPAATHLQRKPSSHTPATLARPREPPKSDPGSRSLIDQSLLKMDKWADAWLSSALQAESSGSDPDGDRAWESFEFCLCMPDVLEDGEILEVESHGGGWRGGNVSDKTTTAPTPAPPRARVHIPSVAALRAEAEASRAAARQRLRTRTRVWDRT